MSDVTIMKLTRELQRNGQLEEFILTTLMGNLVLDHNVKVRLERRKRQLKCINRGETNGLLIKDASDYDLFGHLKQIVHFNGGKLWDHQYWGNGGARKRGILEEATRRGLLKKEWFHSGSWPTPEQVAL